jgi:predicted lipoprotein
MMISNIYSILPNYPKLLFYQLFHEMRRGMQKTIAQRTVSWFSFRRRAKLLPDWQRLLSLVCMTPLLLLFSACTIVPLEEIEAQLESEAFDPEVYVEGVWESVVQPAIVANAQDLATVLPAIEANLESGGEDYGSFVGGAYQFMVKGEGTIAEVLTESRNGTAVVDLAGYDGPATVIVQVGPLIRGNAVRDATGLVPFGDFKDQTEFGQVSREMNKRIAADVLGDLDLENLQGKTVSFDGAFSISTTNQTNIDLSEITVSPVTFDLSE